jgi:predicted nuclease of predicted toxin-antitoxin system
LSNVRLLANENIPGDLIHALRENGFDVAWIRTEAPGSSDPDVMARAVREKRILITSDQDFGELAVRQKQYDCCGVILLRLSPLPLSALVRHTVSALASRSDWEGNFSVIEPGRIRMLPLRGEDTA